MLIINNEAIFLDNSFSLSVYFIVYLLGKNQEIGVWKFGQVDGLRVKVIPDWKRQFSQQVGSLGEKWAFVSGGKALVDLGKGGGGAVADLVGGMRRSSLIHCSSVRGM